MVIAAAAAAAAPMTTLIASGVSVSLIACIVLLPVWVGVLHEYRFGRTIIVMGALAALWGGALSFFEQYRDVSSTLMRGQTLTFLTFVGSIGLLLWCRSQIGLAKTAAWFGIGALANIAIKGVDEENAWKFTFALPVAVTVLALLSESRRRWLEIVALVALGTTSLLSDSRSMTAFFVFTIPVVAWQMFGRGQRGNGRPWQVLMWLSASGLGGYNLFQSLLLEGLLGEDAQQRTAAQIKTAGSLILGGRPEAGAAAALVGNRPMGYGSGTLPSSNDIWVAKTGMSELGYDPNNGYVENYMFGHQIEVHSVLGDLWIRFGPLGAVFALLLLSSAVYAVARAVTQREASSVIVYLLLLGAWDIFFSPALPSARTLALLFAITAIPMARAYAVHRPGHEDPTVRAVPRAVADGGRRADCSRLGAMSNPPQQLRTASARTSDDPGWKPLREG